jgi:ParB-like chromosome segregation protein Spo0J
MQREGCAIAATMEPIGSIRPHPRNPRKNDAAVGTVAGLIQRFGFAAPIVCQASTRTILAGHTRLKAALSLGLQEVPVRFIDVDDDSALAYMLADNKSSELAEWDDEQVAAILSELDGADVDVAGLGWSDEEISDILEGSGSEPAEEDKVPTIWQVLVECSDEAGQARVLDLLMAEGLTCRALTS